MTHPHEQKMREYNDRLMEQFRQHAEQFRSTTGGRLVDANLAVAETSCALELAVNSWRWNYGQAMVRIQAGTLTAAQGIADDVAAAATLVAEAGQAAAAAMREWWSAVEEYHHRRKEGNNGG